MSRYAISVGPQKWWADKNLRSLRFNSGDSAYLSRTPATAFDSTSDQSLKNNIQTVDNAIDIVSDLRGVSFDWKETGKPSYGVIAQELEQVLPELVNGTDQKSVNYNGIIGVLIEAIKELREEIEKLKSSK